MAAEGSKRTRTLGDLADLVGGRVRGDASLPIDDVAPLESAEGRHVSFFANRRYKKLLDATRAGAIILAPEDASLSDGRAILEVKNPYLAFAKVSALFHPVQAPSPGIDSHACVHPEADVDPSATVMAFAYVGRHARIGPHSVLHPGVVVMEEARVGAHCLLHVNASVRERCILGDRVILQPSAVVGSDGFGFAFDPEALSHVKVPQAGIVRIEDDVEIGACSCVDRATLGETVVGAGTKIDNLVQVAHNVRIGPLSILCGQAGVSGSTQIGAGVVLGGQVGIAGHLDIGDRAKIAAQAGVHTNVPADATWAGAPAGPHREFFRNAVAFNRLAQLVTEVRELRAAVAELQKKPATKPRRKSKP
jgi:UDP-3-O-[3-hydroxymyristoyl] glucosamine N-acyltransferase